MKSRFKLLQGYTLQPTAQQIGVSATEANYPQYEPRHNRMGSGMAVAQPDQPHWTVTGVAAVQATYGQWPRIGTEMAVPGANYPQHHHAGLTSSGPYHHMGRGQVRHPQQPPGGYPQQPQQPPGGYPQQPHGGYPQHPPGGYPPHPYPMGHPPGDPGYPYPTWQPPAHPQRSYY